MAILSWSPLPSHFPRNGWGKWSFMDLYKDLAFRTPDPTPPTPPLRRISLPSPGAEPCWPTTWSIAGLWTSISSRPTPMRWRASELPAFAPGHATGVSSWLGPRSNGSTSQASVGSALPHRRRPSYAQRPTRDLDLFTPLAGQLDAAAAAAIRVLEAAGYGATISRARRPSAPWMCGRPPVLRSPRSCRDARIRPSVMLAVGWGLASGRGGRRQDACFVRRVRGSGLG